MGAEVRLVDEGFNIGIRRNWEKSALGCLMRYQPAAPLSTNTVALAMWGFAAQCVLRRSSFALYRFNALRHDHRIRRRWSTAHGSVSMPLPVPQKTRAQVRRIAQHTAGLVEIGVATVIEARD